MGAIDNNNNNPDAGLTPDEIYDREYRMKQQKRRVIALAEAAAQHLDPGYRLTCKMITLTYRPESAWAPRHITNYLITLRNWYRRHTGRQLVYIWVMELQKSGKPHYHIMVWVREGTVIPFADRGILVPWWPHGHTNIRSDIRHGGAYLAKYLTKAAPEGHWFPKRARIFGYGGLHLFVWLARWSRAPGYVRFMARKGTPLKHYSRAYHPGTARVASLSYWDTDQYPITVAHKWRYFDYRNYKLRNLFALLGCDNPLGALSDSMMDAFRAG